METRYFLIVQGQQKGPLSCGELRDAGLTADTPVWREGLENWVKASTLPELSGVLAADPVVSDYPSFSQDIEIEQAPYGQAGQAPYGQAGQAPYGQAGQAPYGQAGQAPYGQAGQAPYGQAGQSPYGQAGQSPYGQAGQSPYGQAGQSPYGQAGQTPYGQPGQTPYGQSPGPFAPQSQYGPVPHTNWLPWAIVATAVSFLCSCNIIGLVFGIIGAVNANKANNFYNCGDEARGTTANSTAKTMTIISLVFAGIGLVSSVILVTSGVFDAILNSASYN